VDRELRVMLAIILWNGGVDRVTNAYIETEEIIVQKHIGWQTQFNL